MKELTQFSEPHDFQSLAVILLGQAVELVSPTRPSQNVRRKMAAKLREALAVLDQATNQGGSTHAGSGSSEGRQRRGCRLKTDGTWVDI